MNLERMIYQRKSVRSYSGVPVDDAILQKISDFLEQAKALYPEIRVYSEIVQKENVKCILPWITPQLISIYSENKPGALENVGFIFQQLDLFLQSLGLGVCWLGMGRMNAKKVVEAEEKAGLNFVIMLAFGHPKCEVRRKSVSEFKRKSIAEISDGADEKLEPARLAPSSVNSQPWYFTHEGKWIHTYCRAQGLFKTRMLSDMNQIDIGIALAHMYVSHPDTFQFKKCDGVSERKGYGYVGSFAV